MLIRGEIAKILGVEKTNNVVKGNSNSLFHQPTTFSVAFCL